MLLEHPCYIVVKYEPSYTTFIFIFGKPKTIVTTPSCFCTYWHCHPIHLHHIKIITFACPSVKGKCLHFQEMGLTLVSYLSVGGL